MTILDLSPKFPNVRSLFIPDPGYVIVDMDLDRADLQCVVWRADDEEMKKRLQAGVDMHMANARDLFGPRAGPRERQIAKQWVHGTNYGGSARTMAITCGIKVALSQELQDHWFTAHPGIKRWHLETERQLAETRTVSNMFGYTFHFWDRIESCLSEALAWQPQSEVGIYINKIWDAIEPDLEHEIIGVPGLEVLLQVHDSLVFQIPKWRFPRALYEVRDIASTIAIPYDDPLVIPVGFKCSDKSWGECKEFTLR